MIDKTMSMMYLIIQIIKGKSVQMFNSPLNFIQTDQGIGIGTCFVGILSQLWAGASIKPIDLFCLIRVIFAILLKGRIDLADVCDLELEK